MKVADTAEQVAKTVVRAATDPRPRLRYTSGKLAGRLAALRLYAPSTMFDSALRKNMRLP